MTLEEKAEQYAIDTYELIEEGQYSDERARIQGYLAGAKELEEENNRLKAENKELKTRVENQKSFLERIRAKFELGEIERKEIEGYLEGEQLTKAKEIIREIMKYEIPTLDYEKAEQFLKE